ncbi:hypothetical protein E2320_002706, partial [Naja naja]
MVEGVASPAVENKGSSKTKASNQSLNEPTLTELLAQQCFLVAETTASIQFQLDKIISTLNYLVSWATSGCPGLTAWQPDAAAGSPCQASAKALANSKQVALNINPVNGNLPHWGSIQLVRGHILQLLGLKADDLKKVELLPSPVYCTRVLLSFDNPNTPKLFFRRGSLLRSFGILSRRVFKDMSIKPLLSNRQLVTHINVPILNAISDTRPLTNYTPIPVKPPDGILSDGSLTVTPTTGQTNPPQQVTSYQEASLDLISWEEMAPKGATPAQGTQGSLVNKPQASAYVIPSIYETDLPQDNFWNMEEIQLFDSFCALPQPERAQIIKCLDAVKSKLWSLSLPDKDPLGFQRVHTDLPAGAPLALSPECLIRKSEDPVLLQTPSADATECLPAMQPINATSTNWISWGRRCGTTEFTNYIQSFDVVLLQETWACDKISLTGFTVTSLATTKQSTTGRPKGGLACLWRRWSCPPPCCSLAMALLIKRGHSKLLVFNIYLPPTVRQVDTKAQWGVLENYITCMETKFPALHILIGGDFNARLGVQPHAPKLSTTKIPLLLYADDAVLLSLSRPGLKRLLSAFGSYCAENHLSINYEKSNVLVFSRARKLYNWAINGNAVRQVFHLKYLGGQLIPSALRIYKAKTLAQTLYGIPIWIRGFKDCIERTQAVFLRKLLGLPPCVGFAPMYLELGIQSVECMAWINTFKWWFRVLFLAVP